MADRDERYRQVVQALEAAGIGIWNWELASNRIAMSANMRKILKIGKGNGGESFETFLRVIHREDRPRIEAALKKAIRLKGSFDEEFRTARVRRPVRWMRIRGRVSLGARGAPERVLGSIHDKTDRKAAFDALANVRTDLEGKIRERTRELLDANELLRREISGKTDLQRQLMQVSEVEQRRIGQDLHDSLSQQLGGMIFMGQVLFERLDRRGLSEARDTKKLVGHLQNALTYTRKLAKGLYPTLDEGGLQAALEELAVSVSELFGVTVGLECARGLNTSDETVTIHIYRIAQEALNNAIKHGQATRMAIRLFRDKGTVVLSISDNGVGFPDKPNKKGIGLNIMEYRASTVGASFGIETLRNRGTVVRCVFGEKSVFAEKTRPRRTS